MEQRRGLCLVLSVALLGQAFAVPLEVARLRRGYADNELDLKDKDLNNLGENSDLVSAGSESRPARQDNINGDSKEDDSKPAESVTTTAKTELATPVYNDDDSDEDDDFEPAPAPAAGGGSNIFSLLRLANAFFPSSSGANAVMRNIIRRYLTSQVFSTSPFLPIGFNNGLNLSPTLLRRQDISENLIHVDEIKGLKPPPFQRQETEEDDDNEDEDSDDESDEPDENNGAEESIEEGGNGGNGNGSGNSNASKPKSNESNAKGSDENNSDYSDEPEGDGQGGGILGILASLSGGEDGQSDLGSLLATVSGIVANLSGDGFDLNALIASGLGLFVGLLSEGEENPGAVIASYLLTSLDTVTGGGSKNNGAFFGTFLSKLIKGTSAGGDPDASSEEGKEPQKDSAGFFASFLMALLGEMSKGSSGGSSSSSSHHPTAEEQKWR